MTMKEKYLNLLDACGDDDDMLGFVLDTAKRFDGYVGAVCESELERPVSKKRYDGDNLRSDLERIDAYRHAAHEAAISAIKQLNRLSERFDVPSLFEGDINDRIQVAEFCMMFTKEIFDDRIL